MPRACYAASIGAWRTSLTLLVHALNNPLKHVPGPYYSLFTRLPLKWAILSGRRIHYVDSLHAKYGPFVRISPVEVSVSDAGAFSEIHRVGTSFRKSDWYHSFTQQKDRFSLLTMTDQKAHASRRKLFARPLSRSFLLENWHDFVAEKARLAAQKIHHAATTGERRANVLDWFTFMANDVVGRLMYGQSFGNLERGTASLMMENVMTRVKVGVIAEELPIIKAVAALFDYLPQRMAPSLFQSHSRGKQYGAESTQSIKSSQESTNIFHIIASEAEKGDGLDTEDIQTEAITFTVAGTDTTGVSLAYLVWCVLSRPDLQAKLEDEVAGLPDNYRDTDVERLPLLNAILAESLRLYTAAPGALPRVVPSTGATMGGLSLPPSTTVSTQAYTYHRDPKLFPNPDEFLPSRWLDDQVSPAAKKIYHPLGAGSRSCVGIHLAYMEMRLATAEFFRACKGARLADSCTPESMEMENHFLVAPIAHKCEIVLPEART
ncbi:hypothetical protein KVT40_002060 [Elsinoe batatas]|uniref:Uncharacterized protein n=1 Tax=Elsinoe batatas TaxID=2601811 RepID=A0A8K0L9T9_9PEZI|nr:hypothetical protein KVT40_002060 [Elsinoe batatas]